MKILQVSDTHFIKHLTNELDKWGVYYDHRKIFENFLSHYNFSEIDLMVHTGDIVHDGEEEDYRAFLDMMRRHVPSHVPVRFVPGNHDKKDLFLKVIDHRTLMANHFIRKEEMEGYRLIYLDTASEVVHHGVITEEVMNWLQEELSTPAEKGTILIQHHPLEISWVDGIEQTEVPKGYYEMLANSDVLAILTGHLHMNRNCLINGITQFTAGSFSFGMTVDGNEIWNIDRLGFSEIVIDNKKLDVFNEIVYPHTKKLNQNIL